MDARFLLEVNCDRLLEQYHTNLEAIQTLQATLIRDILPSVIDEFELGPEATEWAKGWLEDTLSLFRIFRRNNFTRSFTMEAIRKTLVWRLNNLWPLCTPTPNPMLHFLPSNAHDPFGRPIVLIRILPVSQVPDNFKQLVAQAFEDLRLHLKFLNASTPDSRAPILQYIVLLDLDGFSFKAFNTELITWTLREIVPRFPGMLAGVFMLNYSWTHTGLWKIMKRILPASSLSRVFFPSQDELIHYFTPLALPKDYGRSLSFLTHLEDPLRSQETRSPSAVLAVSQGLSHRSDLVPPLPTLRFTSITSLSPTSVLNPFFGYPTFWTHGSPSLQHGRRRKRDLIQTLATLLWIRWRRHIITVLLLATACGIVIRAGLWKTLSRLLRRSQAWKALPLLMLNSK